MNVAMLLKCFNGVMRSVRWENDVMSIPDSPEGSLFVNNASLRLQPPPMCPQNSQLTYWGLLSHLSYNKVGVKSTIMQMCEVICTRFNHLA